MFKPQNILSERIENLTNRVADLESQLAEAQADNAALVEALTLISQFNKNNMLQWCIKNNCQFGAGYEDGNALRLRIAQYIVTLPHPGADLLKELERYKRALVLACKYIREYCPGLICEPVRDGIYWLQQAQAKAGEK